jgi:hypothetical protein
MYVGQLFDEDVGWKYLGVVTVSVSQEIPMQGYNFQGKKKYLIYLYALGIVHL